MTRFLQDLYTCVVQFGTFLHTFSETYWVYPILVFFFIGVFFYLVTDSK